MTDAFESVDKRSVKWTLERLVDLLNEGLDLDQQAISNMLQTRSYCKEPLIQHRDILCVTENLREGPRTTVGILGILNGWSRPLGFRIEAIMAGAEVLQGMGEIISFRLMPVEHAILRKIKGTCKKCGTKEVVIDLTDNKTRCENCGIEEVIPPQVPVPKESPDG